MADVQPDVDAIYRMSRKTPFLFRRSKKGNKVTFSSRPHLGGNLYAADRAKPPIPYKPSGNDDKAMEEIRAKQSEAIERENKVRYEDTIGN